MKTITVAFTEEQYNQIYSALITGNVACDSARSEAKVSGMTNLAELYGQWQDKTNRGINLLADITFDARLAARMI